MLTFSTRTIGSLLLRSWLTALGRNSPPLLIVRFVQHSLGIRLLMCILIGIGCAGEIKITPHEEYDKWAIDIMVKFRDDEKLQLLTGERQSGGVCSLLALSCSLQHLTASASGTIADHYHVPHESNGASSNPILARRRDQPGKGNLLQAFTLVDANRLSSGYGCPC